MEIIHTNNTSSVSLSDVQAAMDRVVEAMNELCPVRDVLLCHNQTWIRLRDFFRAHPLVSDHGYKRFRLANMAVWIYHTPEQRLTEIQEALEQGLTILEITDAPKPATENQP